MKIKKSDFFSPIGIVLILGNLIILNLISTHLFGRIDLTENKVYTLSPVTKQILRDLKEPLTVKAYFTRDLPAPYNNTARFVEDQLAEMKAYGRGNFRFELVDPAEEEKLKKEAEKFRLEPIQVNEMKADKVEFKLAYLGMVFLFEDKQEVIPAIQSLDNLEYEIVSKIRRITASKTPTVGFLEGHGELALREKMTQLDRELRKLYDIKPVDLSQRPAIPDGIDVLCIFGPVEDIPEKDRFAIDQYLMKGGRIFLLANKVKTELQQMSAQPGALRIDPWTSHYGFKLNDDLALDRSCPTLPFQMQTQYGRQVTMVTYPFFPEVINFNRSVAPIKILRQVRLYFPSSLDTTVQPGYELDQKVLFWSSDKATTMSAPYDIDPFNLRGKITLDKARIPLGMVISGKFHSYFANREIPTDDQGQPISTEALIPQSPDTRIVVVGDANMVNDQYLVPGLDNLTFVLNTIDWLAADESLIQIRSRAVVSRPLSEVSDVTRNTVKYANLLLPPLLVIGYGLIRWRIRKAGSRLLKDTMTKGTGGAA